MLQGTGESSDQGPSGNDTAEVEERKHLHLQKQLVQCEREHQREHKHEHKERGHEEQHEQRRGSRAAGAMHKALQAHGVVNSPSSTSSKTGFASPLSPSAVAFARETCAETRDLDAAKHQDLPFKTIGIPGQNVEAGSPKCEAGATFASKSPTPGPSSALQNLSVDTSFPVVYKEAVVELTAFLAEGSSGRVALARWADADEDDEDATTDCGSDNASDNNNRKYHLEEQKDGDTIASPEQEDDGNQDEDGLEKDHSGAGKEAGSFAHAKVAKSGPPAAGKALAEESVGLEKAKSDKTKASPKQADANMQKLLRSCPEKLTILRPSTIDRSQPFALKIIDLKDEGLLSTAPQIQVEMDIMHALSLCVDKSPFVVEYLFAKSIETRAYIGMGVCSGGDLFTLLSYETLKPAEVLFYAVEMALGIQFLHDNLIIHGDLKPENVALNYNGHVRLIDFGLSVRLDPEEHLNRLNGRCEVLTQSGTLPYCAPEIMNRKTHGVETDWWSYAVILYEMLFGCLPWYSEDDQETCSLICGAPLDIPSDGIFEPRCFDLLERLLVKRREDRLGFSTGLSEIQRHRFFKRVDWRKAQQQRYRAPFILDNTP